MMMMHSIWTHLSTFPLIIESDLYRFILCDVCKQEQMVDRELERILAEQKRKLQKKEKREEKRKQKGPRMSAPTRVEL